MPSSLKRHMHFGIDKYEPMIAAMRSAYDAQGVTLNYNNAVKTLTCMKNKRLILVDGHHYFNPADCHYGETTFSIQGACKGDKPKRKSGADLPKLGMVGFCQPTVR